MRIVSYNLHFGGRKGPGNAWEIMGREFAADLVCAQESRDPCRDLAAGGDVHGKHCLWKSAQDRNWGSAILARSALLEPVPLDAYEGWVIGARVHDIAIGDGRRSLMVFSIHAKSPSPYPPVVAKILDCIGRAWDGTTPLILAGDFNMTMARRQARETLKNVRAEIDILKRMHDEFGVVNAWQALHPDVDLPQTLRWSNDPKLPFHCDGILVSESLVAGLASACIVQQGHWATASDHNPIVVDFR